MGVVTSGVVVVTSVVVASVAAVVTSGVPAAVVTLVRLVEPLSDPISFPQPDITAAQQVTAMQAESIFLIFILNSLAFYIGL